MKKKIKCILVDDDSDEELLFRMGLEHLDISCDLDRASGGGEALELFFTNEGYKPDFIFIDLNMCGISGKELVQKLKEIEHLQSVPTIIYSTSSEENDIKDAKRLNVDHYFVKPACIKTLSETLEKLFNKERLPFLLPDNLY